MLATDPLGRRASPARKHPRAHPTPTPAGAGAHPCCVVEHRGLACDLLEEHQTHSHAQGGPVAALEQLLEVCRKGKRRDHGT